jgi:hypothetical protein
VQTLIERTLAIGPFVALAAVGIWWYITPNDRTDSHYPLFSQCHLIHKPAAGCPEGSQLMQAFFTKKDKTTADACYVAAAPKQCIDILHPGEAVKNPVQLPE